MGVTVRFQKNLQHILKVPASVCVEGADVRQCMDQVFALYPHLREPIGGTNRPLLEHVLILVNGKGVFPEETAKSVREGDIIDLALLVDGG